MIRYQGKEYTSNVQPVTTMDSFDLTPVRVLKQIFNLHNQKEITEISNKIAKYGIIMLCKFSCRAEFLLN